MSEPVPCPQLRHGLDPLQVADQLGRARRLVLPAASRGRTLASSALASAADRPNQKHIALWWEGDGSPPAPADVLTAEALTTLKDLRNAAAERQAEFEALAPSLRGA